MRVLCYALAPLAIAAGCGGGVSEIDFVGRGDNGGAAGFGAGSGSAGTGASAAGGYYSMPVPEACRENGLVSCAAGPCEGICVVGGCSIGINSTTERNVGRYCKDEKSVGISDVETCTACSEAAACALLVTGLSYLTCRPREACQILVEKGMKGCFYTDTTDYTGEPLPDAVPCPSTGLAPFCGGTCGGCPESAACSGRSPTHPFGLCLPRGRKVGSACAASGGCAPEEACFIYDSGPQNTSLYAIDRGQCFPKDTCVDIATRIPGGGACIRDGVLLAGSLP